MDLGKYVTIGTAVEEDISGITEVLRGTLEQDFRYGLYSFEENVEYSFSRSIKHQHEGVYVAKLHSLDRYEGIYVTNVKKLSRPLHLVDNTVEYVTEPDGRPLYSQTVGFAWFMNHPPNNGTAILEMFAVRKDLQRRGIGTRLIKDSCDQFVERKKMAGINLRTLHLTTNYSNDGARTIYQRAGFQPVALIPGFVGDGNVEVFMLKRLTSERAPEEYVTR